MTRTILCLCTGNYCRSPLAEGLLRRELTKRGQAGQIAVHSAGAGSQHAGKPPAPLIVQIVEERGGSLDGYSPHQVRPAEVLQANLILAMGQEHVDYIREHYPQALPRTMLLAELVGLTIDVADPCIQELNALRGCADVIEDYILRGYDEIIRRLTNP